MKILRKSALTVAMAAVFASSSAFAYEAGDMMVRVGAAGVYPTGDSDNITPVDPNAKVEADDAWSLGITFSYMFTDSIGLGVLGAYPFEHDIEGKGSISGLGKVATTKQLPPTVTLQYYFNNSSPVTPFLGAGFNYTYFFDEDTKGALSDANLDLDDSWGWALEGGLDFDINEHWMVSGQVYYINIETEAKISGVPGKYNVDINPWVYFLSAGYKF
jgi:outer membrane protein